MKPEELAKNPNAPELLLKIAAGNADALRWMWSVWCFAHLYDDLVDGDKPVKPEEAAHELARFVEQMACNAFFRQHSASLTALMVSAINRWITGEQMNKNEKASVRTMARAVRCGDVDLYLHVAYLIGGWNHMRAMSELMRFDGED